MNNPTTPTRSIQKGAVLGLIFALILGTTLAFSALSTTPGDSGFQSAGAYMLTSGVGDGYDRATDSLEAIRDRIDLIPWGTSGGNIYYSAANVGIGATTAARDLHVTDTMRLEPRATLPSTPALGDLYVDSNTNELCFYDGSAWQGLSSGTDGNCA